VIPQTARALLVGINRYAHLEPTLQGCENDARTMDELLRTRFGFTQTTLLLSEQATRAGLCAAFEQLIADTNTDDVVVFYFAGHGGRIRDREGDEPSGFDCTLVPTDSMYDPANPAANIDILDDEIFLYLQRLGNKTKAITVIVDACHSGTISRDVAPIPGFRVRGLPADTRITDVPSPVPKELWSLLRGASDGTAIADTTTARRATGGWLPVQDHYVTISSCRDAEKSGEVLLENDDKSETYHGAFTWYLSRGLLRVTPGTTYRTLFEAVAPNVTAYRQGRQHPQLEGAVDRELFGLRELPPMPYVRVRSVSEDGNSITVAAGAALGLAVGAVMAVYARGTTATEGTTPDAMADVTAVRALDCTATVRADGRVNAITASSRAVIQQRGASDARQAVFVAPLDEMEADARTELHASLVAARDALQTAIAASALLRVVEAPTVDALQVRLWSSTRSVDADASSAASRWAITGSDGLPLAPFAELEEGPRVRRNLEILARRSLAVSLVNEDPASKLSQAKPTIELLIAREGEAFRSAAAGAGGLPEYDVGDFIGVRIANPHTTPVYVTLLDIGQDGRITVVYPPRHAVEVLAVGASMDLFTTPSTLQPLSFPSVYPFAPDGDLPLRDDGLETIKLFATSHPASFEWLTEKAGVRSVDDSPVERLLRARMNATRGDGAAPPPPPDDDWTTVSASFVLRRAP